MVATDTLILEKILLDGEKKKRTLDVSVSSTVKKHHYQDQYQGWKKENSGAGDEAKPVLTQKENTLETLHTQIVK